MLKRHVILKQEDYETTPPLKWGSRLIVIYYKIWNVSKLVLTRQHSSSMRTAGLPPVSHCIPCLGEGVSTHPETYSLPLDITIPCTYQPPWTYPQKGPGTRNTHPPERTWDQKYSPLAVDRRTPVKTLPSRNFVGGR